MDLDRLAIFRDVARFGGIAAAARSRNRDPSWISRTIGALEAELGVRLVQRTTRRLELTEAGERYLRRVEPLLEEFAAANEDVRGSGESARGRLRVTASSAFGQAVLAPLLGRFRADYPQIELELLLTDAVVDLVTERIDVAIRLGPRPAGDVIAALLAETKMYLVASSGYLRSSSAILSPADVITGQNLIATLPPSTTWLFRRAGELIEFPVSGCIATSNTLAARRFACEGLGMAVLADWLVRDDVVADRLQIVLPEWEAAVGMFGRGIWVVYPSRQFLAAKSRAFIDYLKLKLMRPLSS